MRIKGLALITVLAFTIAVSIIAITILILNTSQARLSEHKFRRTLAYYAANAGIVYGMELLRTDPVGVYSTNPGTVYCRTGEAILPAFCTGIADPTNPPSVPDPNLQIQHQYNATLITHNVTVRFRAKGADACCGVSRPVDAFVDYTP